MKALSVFPQGLVASILSALLLVACGRQEPPATEPPAAEAPVTETPSAPPERVPLTTASEDARALYADGIELFQNLKFVEARGYFEQAVEQDPDFAMAYFFLANTAPTVAEFGAASARAEALADNVSPGEALMIKAQAAGGRNDQAAQQDYLTQLVAMHPKDERTHFQLANYHMAMQEYAAAIEHYGHTTAIKPDLAPAYNALGYALRASGRLEEAEAAFRSYRDLVPDEANPYDSYAELLMALGRYDESIENYQAALERDPNFISAHAGISVNQSLKGDKDAAIAAAAAMLAMARNNSERRNANFREATAHLFAGDVDGALAAIQKNVALSETEGNHAALANHYQYMGDMMLDAGDGARGLEHYRTSLEHSQRADVNEAVKAQAERNFLFKSAIAAMVAGEEDTAAARMAEYTAVAEAGGTASERRRIHAMNGFFAMLKEDYATSAAEFAQGDLSNPVVLYWGAVVHKESGDNATAAEWAANAANGNPLSPSAPFVRTEALELLAQLEG